MVVSYDQGMLVFFNVFYELRYPFEALCSKLAMGGCIEQKLTDKHKWMEKGVIKIRGFQKPITWWFRVIKA